MTKTGRKKKYKRKICGECGKQRSKNKMEYIGRKWYCEDCQRKSNYEPSISEKLDKIRNVSKERNEAIENLASKVEKALEATIKPKRCSFCGGIMIEKKGYWKCLGCGGFTRRD